jgi:hypothetical protein
MSILPLFCIVCQDDTELVAFLEKLQAEQDDDEDEDEALGHTIRTVGN